MQVGKSRYQGLYNKPSAAVHPGELAAVTLTQYNTIKYKGLNDGQYMTETSSPKLSLVIKYIN